MSIDLPVRNGNHVTNGISEAEIFAEHIRTLYSHAARTVLGFLILAPVFAALMWPYANHQHLLIWLALVGVALFFRGASWIIFNRVKPAIADMIVWARASAVISFLIGMAWALAPILFLGGDDDTRLIIVTGTLFGITAVSVVPLASYFPSFAAHTLTILFVLLGVLVLRGDDASYSIAALVIVAIVMNTTYCLNVRRIMDQSLRLTFENIGLREIAESKSTLLETTLQSMSQGIGLVRGDGTLRMWNQRFFDLLNKSPDALFDADRKTVVIGRTIDSLSPPIQIGQESRSEHYSATGAIIDVLQSHTPDKDRVITLTDISVLKDREAALEQARRDAESANAAKTRFLASASHDLRQPIHALGLNIENLSLSSRDEHNDSLFDQVSDSLSAVDKMLGTLLDVSKLDAGVVIPTIRPVDLQALLKSLNGEFQAQAKESDNRFTIGATEAAVLTDEGMLGSILRNLITNALRYTEGGDIRVMGRQVKSSYKITVCDTGYGIPEDQLTNIFVEFHQLQNPHRDRNLGLGLGLSIVKRLSDLLGHQLSVRSTLGKGTCFSVTLPCADAQATRELVVHKSAIADGTLVDARVLVVDDDVTIVSAMQVLMERWGCVVSTSTNIDDALTQLDRLYDAGEKVDLVISDYRLEGNLTGIDLVNEINSDKSRQIPAIIITGDTAPDRLLNAQASSYPVLHKPVQPAKLRTTIRNLLSGSRRLTAAIAHTDIN